MISAEQVLRTTEDDHSFCDFCLASAQFEWDTDHALTLLFTPWILQRLQAIQRRVPHIYYGVFLAPLRRQFPREVLPADLHAAMRGIEELEDGQSGDVSCAALTYATEQFYKSGITSGLSPGWSNLAQHYTVRPGEITLVTGVSNHMKSLVVNNLCVNLARIHHWHISLFSPELFPPEFLAASMQEHYSDTRLAEMPEEMFRETLVWVTQHFHVIQPPEEVPPTLAYLLAVARYQIAAYGIKGLVLDPWNEIDHQYGGRYSETQYISECLSKIRRFARHHQVHVWIVAHPAKMQKATTGPYAGHYPPPRPYDVSGSAHWYNKPDNCLSVWRDVEGDDGRLEIHIQKVRYRSVGRPGLVTLVYTGRRFVEEEEKERAW